MQSISRTQEVKESAELYERIFEVEGMLAEFPNDEWVSFAALDEVVTAGPEEIDGDMAEDGAPRLRAAYDLSFADRAVVQRIKAASWAATPGEIHAHADQIERLADAGVAYLRTCGKRVVLAMAGATVGDVRRAAARARSSDRGTRRRQEKCRPHEEECREGASCRAGGFCFRARRIGAWTRSYSVTVSCRSDTRKALRAGNSAVRVCPPLKPCVV